MSDEFEYRSPWMPVPVNGHQVPGPVTEEIPVIMDNAPVSPGDDIIQSPPHTTRLATASSAHNPLGRKNSARSRPQSRKRPLKLPVRPQRHDFARVVQIIFNPVDR